MNYNELTIYCSHLFTSTIASPSPLCFGRYPATDISNLQHMSESAVWFLVVAKTTALRRMRSTIETNVEISDIPIQICFSKDS